MTARLLTRSLALLPGLATTLSITTQPGNTNGTVDSALQQQPKIHVLDQFGNFVSDNTTVTASLVTGTGSLRNLTTDTSSGDATFTNLGYSKSGETFSIKFSTNGHDSATSNSITALLPGAAATLSITTQPGNTNGTVDSALQQQPKIHVLDQFGNFVSDNTTVTASLVTGTGSLRNLTADTSSGDATFTNLGYSKSGETFSIKFSTNGHDSAASNSITALLPGAAATLTITTQPGNTNGTVDSALQQQPKIHVLDQFGNFVSDNTTVTASLVTGTGSLRNLTADTSSGDATFTNLGYSKSGETFSIKFSTNGHDSAASNSITALLPGAAATLSITTQPGNTNGTVDSALQQQPKIHVLDQFGNFVSDNTTVTASLVTGTGSLRNLTADTSSGDATFTNLGYSKSGETFSIKFSTNGHDSAASNSITALLPGAAATLSITTQPGNTNGTVDSALQQQPKIHVLDQFGNFVSDNTTVTASLVTGTGSLRNLTADTSSGDATFTNLGYSKSGETFSIKFSTNGHDSAASNSITALLPGAAATLSITTQPGNTNGTVDSALQQQPKIHVLDQFGNFVSDNTTVTASLVTGTGSLRNLTADTSSGDATFTNLGYSKSGETFSIKFSTNGHDSAASNSITALLPGLAQHLLLLPSQAIPTAQWIVRCSSSRRSMSWTSSETSSQIIPPLPRA